MTPKKKIKAWAITSSRGVLIGGGDKEWGYFNLCVYSTREGAKLHLTPTRPTDKIVPCEITYSLKGK